MNGSLILFLLLEYFLFKIYVPNAVRYSIHAFVKSRIYILNIILILQGVLRATGDEEE